MSHALVRAEGYRLLGLAFAHPDPELLVRELESAPSELDAIALRLVPHIDDCMAAEHTRLFSQTTPVSPYEGHYFASDKGVLMGQLAKLYELFGARVGGEERESPDHIGVELEFAALLSVKAALANARGAPAREELEITEAARRVFMEEHLGRWTEALGARISAAARHRFYVALGDVLADWVRADIEQSGFAVDPERKAMRRMLPVVEVQSDELACGATAGS